MNPEKSPDLKRLENAVSSGGEYRHLTFLSFFVILL